MVAERIDFLLHIFIFYPSDYCSFGEIFGGLNFLQALQVVLQLKANLLLVKRAKGKGRPAEELLLLFLGVVADTTQVDDLPVAWLDLLFVEVCWVGKGEDSEDVQHSVIQGLVLQQLIEIGAEVEPLRVAVELRLGLLFPSRLGLKLVLLLNLWLSLKLRLRLWLVMWLRLRLIKWLVLRRAEVRDRLIGNA